MTGDSGAYQGLGVSDLSTDLIQALASPLSPSKRKGKKPAHGRTGKSRMTGIYGSSYDPICTFFVLFSLEQAADKLLECPAV